MDIDFFYISQLETFPLAQKNYSGLQDIIYRHINFNGFEIRTQHNPARILSTNARIDNDSIKARKCFLCRENMPEKQEAFPYDENYSLFINPYPIFEKHFTIPARSHVPQRIDRRIEDMLNLAYNFPGYTIFYNGPQSGASAPDHFHFQMIPACSVPLKTDTENELLKEIIEEDGYHSIFTLKDYIRRVIVFTASDLRLLANLIKKAVQAIGDTIPYENEPMINIFAWFDNCQWTVSVFPRGKHRPWQFFVEGENKILFSPGAIDMAGVVVAPRSEDFNRYTAGLLTGLFAQVSINEADWKQILQKLQTP